MGDMIDRIEDAPTVDKGIADALECYRRRLFAVAESGIKCEDTTCKWRCDGRALGLGFGYCAYNNLLADAVRALGGEVGKPLKRGDVDETD